MWYRDELLSPLLLNGIPNKHDERYLEDIPDRNFKLCNIGPTDPEIYTSYSVLLELI
jgi:hypothetical protein